MRNVFRAALAIAVAGALPACNATTSSTDGAQIFSDMCARCHGPDGKPSQVMIQQLAVRDLTQPEFRQRLTVDLVRNQVRYGSKTQTMPAFGGALHDEQIDAVANYVFKRFK